jgi:lipopolysaccharide/colanic/teichoic acid biosynthesis glycosyltransferase
LLPGELVETHKTRYAPAASLTFADVAYSLSKRVLDLIGALILTIVMLPVFLVVAIAVFLDSGLPILYRCRRIGRDGAPITVLKFRTMRDGSHHHLEALLTASEERRMEYIQNRKFREDPRRTRLGTFLRRTSLDETPQLLNVLAGDMSLVGPRPYMPDELRGRSEAVEILSVRPGITGLWQVNGRSDRSFEDRVALDVEYVRRRGLLFDLSLAARTLGAVVSGRGAY